MSTPDTPITLAHDRFGHWLHVTGIGLADVVRALPERFLSRALLVFDPEQLDYATSPLMQERRREGAAIEAYASELATHEDLAFWNSTEPLFENRACAVWPENTLAEMIRVQGRSGGMFGVCAIPTERVATLPDDFVYEHPSNVDAPLAFISMDDTATSVYVTEQEDVQILLSALVAKSLGMDDPSAPGVSDVAERLLPLAEADGIDIRPQLDEAGQPVSAIVSVGLWDLGSQWALLWRDVQMCDITWSGSRWELSEPRLVSGRSHVSGIRLVGEALQWTVRAALIVGLPLAMVVFTWMNSGPAAGILALVIAVVLWPRFVLRRAPTAPGEADKYQ